MATDTSVASALETVERLRPVIEHHRDEGEGDRRLSPAIVQAMDSEGLFRYWLPVQYGGNELDLPTYLRVVEELSRLDSATGWIQGIIGTSAILSAYLPDEACREMFREGMKSVGSVIPRGQAIPVEGGYRVSGRWPLMSGCHHADWIAGNSIVIENGAPRVNEQGIPDFTMMIFPAEDGQIIDTWHSTGMRGTGSADFAVDNVFVPAHRTFSVLTAQPRIQGPLYRLRIDVLFYMGLTVVGLGIARRAIDSFMEIARTKTPSLSQSPLASRATVHAEVARAEARYLAARAFFYEVAGELMAAAIAGDVPEALEARRRLACVTVAEACESVVDAMFRLAGTLVIYTGHQLERCLRDIHTINQHLAVSPVWWEKTGQFYFGQGLGMP